MLFRSHPVERWRKCEHFERACGMRMVRERSRLPARISRGGCVAVDQKWACASMAVIIGQRGAFDPSLHPPGASRGALIRHPVHITSATVCARAVGAVGPLSDHCRTSRCRTVGLLSESLSEHCRSCRSVTMFPPCRTYCRTVRLTVGLLSDCCRTVGLFDLL